MNRADLQNAIIDMEQDLGRNPYHISGSRKKYIGGFYLEEVGERDLKLFLAHLDQVKWEAQVGKQGKKQLDLF